MNCIPEKSAPVLVKPSHIGIKVLYRIPNQAFVSEGEIVELSPEGNFFKIGRCWLPNNPNTVLAVLSKRYKRKSAFAESGK